jgi:hypothetical protein
MMAIKNPETEKPHPPDSLQDDSKSHVVKQDIPIPETNPSKSPANNREELNPIRDVKKEFIAAGNDQPRFPEGIESRVTVPNDFMNQVAIILKDGGMDSMSQLKALGRIGEIVFPPPTKSDSDNIRKASSGVKINQLPPESKPALTNRPSSVPDLSKTEPA